jgi:xanthine/uracil permease
VVGYVVALFMGKVDLSALEGVAIVFLAAIIMNLVLPKDEKEKA